MSPYPKFAAMIATSTVVMFGLMYLNTYSLDHIFFSETRAYMALVMGATMAAIMLGFMLKMYENRTASSPRARSGRPDHRGTAQGNRRNESLNRRHQKQVANQTNL